ncbi:MAG: hypothetical protein V1834_02705 [Candidatus Micrarchaeota archaeon]
MNPLEAIVKHSEKMSRAILKHEERDRASFAVQISTLTKGFKENLSMGLARAPRNAKQNDVLRQSQLFKPELDAFKKAMTQHGLNVNFVGYPAKDEPEVELGKKLDRGTVTGTAYLGKCHELDVSVNGESLTKKLHESLQNIGVEPEDIEHDPDNNIHRFFISSEHASNPKVWETITRHLTQENNSN